MIVNMPRKYFDKVITNCDNKLLQIATTHIITNCDKVPLHIVSGTLLQIATTAFTNCDRYYRLRRYYKL